MSALLPIYEVARGSLRAVVISVNLPLRPLWPIPSDPADPLTTTDWARCLTGFLDVVGIERAQVRRFCPSHGPRWVIRPEGHPIPGVILTSRLVTKREMYMARRTLYLPVMIATALTMALFHLLNSSAISRQEERVPLGLTRL
jgi:hypothetical protein